MANAPTLTGILTSIVLVSLIITGTSLFLTGTASTYGGNTTELEDEYVASFIDESRNTMDRLETARGDLSTVDEDRNVLDRLASFFRSGYDAARALLGGIDSITRLVYKSVGQIPFLGTFGGALSGAIGIMVLITIIGVFMHFLIKSERI